MSKNARILQNIVAVVEMKLSNIKKLTTHFMLFVPTTGRWSSYATKCCTGMAGSEGTVERLRLSDLFPVKSNKKVGLLVTRNTFRPCWLQRETARLENCLQQS
jgi:hypothetical protein